MCLEHDIYVKNANLILVIKKKTKIKVVSDLGNLNNREIEPVKKTQKTH